MVDILTNWWHNLDSFTFKEENSMKKIKKLIFAFMAAFALLCCASIAFPNTFGTERVDAAVVKINQTRIYLDIGDKYRLKITGTNQKVKWKSSRPKSGISRFKRFGYCKEGRNSSYCSYSRGQEVYLFSYCNAYS